MTIQTEEDPLDPLTAIEQSRQGLEKSASRVNHSKNPAHQEATLKKRRSRLVRNPFVMIANGVISLFVLLALVMGVALYYGKSIFDGKGPLIAEKVLVIPQNSGLASIADYLQREGIVADRTVFVTAVRLYRQSGNLKAGEYAFPAGVTMREVMDILVSGRSIVHTITFPEGMTSRQIVERLRADPLLTGDIPLIPAEGSLLPETYTYTRGAERGQILAQLQKDHKKALEEAWAKRQPDLPLRTPQELVTLASIVEKETGKAEERPRVAAVFINRLRAGMRLQSDPTIIYGIVGGKGALGRPLTRSDIDTPTPYNTYQIDGLPPGPITNPGRAALEAVARPLASKELYFVADGTGGHVFAETYEEHTRNVARWRAIEANGGALSPAERTVDSGPDAVLDLRDGMPPRDPAQPIRPVRRPAG